MKTKTFFLFVFLAFSVSLYAEEEVRELSSFSEISLRVSGTVHLQQGSEQNVRVVASSSALEDLITEVRGRQLIIRFPSTTFFRRSFNPGRIDIYITVPEIDALAISGSGDIVAEDLVETRILDLAVSGSGNILLKDLNAERVKAAISGSGDIEIEDGAVANELEVAITGSGDVRADEYEVEEVNVRIAGSGDCTVTSYGNINARIAGSGSVYYQGNPNIDASIAGSGSVEEM